ncbi:hypothetical protein H4R26_002637 [Coemansia thaxteri]|uniref:THUMP domain-containing protein n=1 Tax=Coemansia thaxteri TaxID=2663907 RepID=A0A9W8EIB0_9FUNG|nr:hypothetical protein H4R26_002637 [Coemansia thaxteri]KAJ2485850.1 hypothetical protein EV174_001465 [Coemansia sp. RSA 2320]
MGKRSADRSGPQASQQKRTKQSQQARDRYKNPQNTFAVSPGMRGFFVTCVRGREKKSAMETIDLLEEYASKLYPGIEEDIENEGELDDEAAPGGDDIEDEIARELADMKSTSKPRLFRYLPMTIECLVYIKCHRKIDPQELVHFLFEDLSKTKQRKTRYTSRLIPAQVTTTSKLDAIVRGAAEVTRDLLAEDAVPTTFALVVNIRYCDDVKRDSIIPAVAAPLDVKHKVDLKNAEYTLVIEAFKSMCTIGLVKNYTALRRLNLQTLFDEPAVREAQPEAAVATRADKEGCGGENESESDAQANGDDS